MEFDEQLDRPYILYGGSIMDNDFFRDLRCLLDSRTLPNRAKVTRILSAYKLGTITLIEAVEAIAECVSDLRRYDD